MVNSYITGLNAMCSLRGKYCLAACAHVAYKSHKHTDNNNANKKNESLILYRNIVQLEQAVRLLSIYLLIVNAKVTSTISDSSTKSAVT